jgi:hypothetical protein
LSQIFSGEGKLGRSAFASVETPAVERIINRLNAYERQLTEQTKDQSLGEEYRRAFRGIREELERNPKEFLTETCAWIDSSLRRGRSDGILGDNTSDSTSVRRIESQDQTTIISTPATAKYHSWLQERARSNIDRLNTDADGRSLVLEASSTRQYLRPYQDALMLGLDVFYVWGLLAGTLPITYIVAYPLFGLWSSLNLTK